MFDVILYEPEIPPNTGNIIRLCANTGMRLHLVETVRLLAGRRQMRRAGLDYHEYATVKVYDDWPACAASFQGKRVFAVSTKDRNATMPIAIAPAMCFCLVRKRGDYRLRCSPTMPASAVRLPMLPDSRSLNLSNAVAVVVYEALRQLDFGGCV